MMLSQVDRDWVALFDAHPEAFELPDAELRRRYWPWFSDVVAYARIRAIWRIGITRPLSRLVARLAARL